MSAATSVKHLALLRGINVGGKNLLPMKELIAIFSTAGCDDVGTYIQSGNVLFNAPSKLLPRLSSSISEEIAARLGLRVPVILRTFVQLEDVLNNNPFLKVGAEEKLLHVYFLANTPDQAAVIKLDPNRSPADEFRVIGQHIYLRLPNGMGNTKLTNAYFDAKLATVSTARNWATLRRLLERMER